MRDSSKTEHKNNEPKNSAKADQREIELTIDGKKRVFDIDAKKLPKWVRDNALTAGGYPYDKRMPKDEYKDTLEKLQIELVKLQYWMQDTGERVLAIFEGRDTAGKGGSIQRLRQYMNPRSARSVALPKPTDSERGQWYFQRYVSHFPGAGEFVTFDRSWYNRGVVEPVMGFCTPAQVETFLDETPNFEKMVVSDGINFFKFWLNIGQETQLERFHDRHHSPLKNWKFSPIDLAGIARWSDYTEARDKMMQRTHTAHAPWTVVRANDKRRARLAVIRRVLLSLPYKGRNLEAIGSEDDRIIGSGPKFLTPGT
ncbi:polyphosphate kinase 2 [Phyllobacterium phragmitis]|uniref:ADP/GDP-polyphosphate phosphotransferase n=1 Tax=Phyllobacterium phragmitis TaxID=2670329 RepID=A0A2S9IKH5_9HYPH|nr:polyphosphate kinase 2 [Phyllobacterium phragmitis]PRD41027.1 polyphosphate kinase 2 [Phyllobacterium phragmitis]